MTVAASDSMRGRPARSASAAGRSAACRRPSGARRGASPARRRAASPAVEPSTQSSRVWLTISMIVGTPRPSSPTSRAQAPSNSTSLDALERLPSLSFRRWRWKRLRVAVGQDARQQEAGQAAVGLREHQEGVAHRRRAEPLVAGDLVLGPGPAAVQRRARRWCWRARPSRPASRSSPCRTARRPCRRRARAAGRSDVDVSRGSHSAASSGVRAQRRHAGVGHRDRAAGGRPRPGPSS